MSQTPTHAPRHAAPRTSRSPRRAATTTLALAAAGLILAPTSAFAAGTPHGPKAPAPKPKPASGPVQTVTKVSTSKTPTAAKALTVSARVSPAHRGPKGAPAETGTVTFTVDGAASAPIPVSHNRASEHIKLTAGKHTIDAKYSGDAGHAASDSGPVTITVA